MWSRADGRWPTMSFAGAVRRCSVGWKGCEDEGHSSGRRDRRSRGADRRPRTSWACDQSGRWRRDSRERVVVAELDRPGEVKKR